MKTLSRVVRVKRAIGKSKSHQMMAVSKALYRGLGKNH